MTNTPPEATAPTAPDDAEDFESTEATSEGTTDANDLKRKAYANAVRRLREEFREEFENFREQESKALGVEYKRKPTEEEKAEAEVAELLRKFPNLRERIAPPA